MWELFDQLSTARGRRIRVAIVDSGVEEDHPWVGGRLASSFVVVGDERRGYSVVEGAASDGFGHGTAAAGQIRRFSPDAELISVRVLGGDLRTNSQSLLTALRWLTTQDLHVVNLSLSTMRADLALRMSHSVDDLYARNIACVCARGYHLTGKAYPTNFSGTIGVSFKYLPQAQLQFRPLDPVAFDAAGIGLTVAWKGGATRTVEGSSYACPLVTGLAARFLELRPTLTPYELKSLLKEYAHRQANGWWEPWMDAVDLPPT